MWPSQEGLTLMTLLVPKFQRRGAIGGFSLIEVLVAILVLSIGLLGLAGLQATSLRANDGAYLRTQATMLTYDLFDSMRANRSAALAGDYEIDLGDSAPTGSSRAAQDLNFWLGELATKLPSGDGEVDCSNAPNCRVTVEWNDERAGGEATIQFQVESQP